MLNIFRLGVIIIIATILKMAFGSQLDVKLRLRVRVCGGVVRDCLVAALFAVIDLVAVDHKGAAVEAKHILGLKHLRFPRDGVTALQATRSEEHTSELQSRLHLVCRLLLEKKKKKK